MCIRDSVMTEPTLDWRRGSAPDVAAGLGARRVEPLPQPTGPAGRKREGPTRREQAPRPSVLGRNGPSRRPASDGDRLVRGLAALPRYLGATPTPTRTPAAPPAPAPGGGSAYANCAAARAAGAAPLHRGDPGYRSGLDRDGDGIACE